MKITVLSMWYNEAVLAPLFLAHYHYADRIHILLDADTNDGTERSFFGRSKVSFEPFRFPDMMDDKLKVAKLNEVAQKLDTDWLYVVDADEFLFPHNFEDVYKVLPRQTGNVMIAKMWQVYRHASDKDLKFDRAPVFQRRHGDPDRESRPNVTYCKPIIIKMPMKFQLTPGNHQITGERIVPCTESFDGVHWMMADPSFAVKRRVQDRKLRQSHANKQNGFTIQHHLVTEEQVLDICKQHTNDPLLF